MKNLEYYRTTTMTYGCRFRHLHNGYSTCFLQILKIFLNIFVKLKAQSPTPRARAYNKGLLSMIFQIYRIFHRVLLFNYMYVVKLLSHVRAYAYTSLLSFIVFHSLHHSLSLTLLSASFSYYRNFEKGTSIILWLWSV